MLVESKGNYLKQTVEKVAILCSNCEKQKIIDVNILYTNTKKNENFCIEHNVTPCW